MPRTKKKAARTTRKLTPIDGRTKAGRAHKARLQATARARKAAACPVPAKACKHTAATLRPMLDAGDEDRLIEVEGLGRMQVELCSKCFVLFARKVAVLVESEFRPAAAVVAPIAQPGEPDASQPTATQDVLLAGAVVVADGQNGALDAGPISIP